MSNQLSIIVLGVLLLAACTPGSINATKPAGPSAPASAVTGTVTYLQRSALTPTAVIEVQLQDVSKMDAPAEVISTQAIEANGKQVPFAYELKYDPAKIDPAHRYTVRATIKDGDKLLFTSTTIIPVITNGAPTSNVEIIVEPVSSGGADFAKRDYWNGDLSEPQCAVAHGGDRSDAARHLKDGRSSRSD